MTFRSFVNKNNKFHSQNENIMSAEPSEIIEKIEGLTLSEEGISVKIKPPKRVLHFSDGVIEEYSTDEENGKDDDVVDTDESNKVVDEVILSVNYECVTFQFDLFFNLILSSLA